MRCRADGRADKSTDGRRCRLDFDGSRVGQHMDMELLGAVQQQHRQSLLSARGWLPAGWAAHASHRSPSLPEPNRRDVSALRLTRSRLHVASTRTHARSHNHTGARTRACLCSKPSERTRAHRSCCAFVALGWGYHHRILSDNLLNGALPESLTSLTRLKRLYAAPLRFAAIH
jgi:hypothetical protein